MMNVIGASVSEAFYASHETRDIVLPNQTESVSQIAIDVNTTCCSWIYKILMCSYRSADP